MKLIDTLKSSELLNKHVDLDYALSQCDAENVDDIIEKLETFISEVEIIGYADAAKFLWENDPSLKESLSFAAEFGYPLEGLSIEVLANLLLQETLRRELYEVLSN